MAKGLKPDFYLESLLHVSPENLLEHGVKGLLLDIDNTLVPNHTPDADEAVISFVSRMQESGVRMAILSNASRNRIERFNRPLGLPVARGAIKPLKKGYLHGLELLEMPPENVCMAGDQLFTDVLGAKRVGIRSILLLPMHQAEPWYVRLKRLLERAFLGGMKPVSELTEPSINK